jgi:hypothetical protein
MPLELATAFGAARGSRRRRRARASGGADPRATRRSRRARAERLATRRITASAARRTGRRGPRGRCAMSRRSGFRTRRLRGGCSVAAERTLAILDRPRELRLWRPLGRSGRREGSSHFRGRRRRCRAAPRRGSARAGIDRARREPFARSSVARRRRRFQTCGEFPDRDWVKHYAPALEKSFDPGFCGAYRQARHTLVAHQAPAHLVGVHATSVQYCTEAALDKKDKESVDEMVVGKFTPRPWALLLELDIDPEGPGWNWVDVG